MVLMSQNLTIDDVDFINDNFDELEIIFPYSFRLHEHCDKRFHITECDNELSIKDICSEENDSFYYVEISNLSNNMLFYDRVFLSVQETNFKKTLDVYTSMSFKDFILLQHSNDIYSILFTKLKSYFECMVCGVIGSYSRSLTLFIDKILENYDGREFLKDFYCDMLDHYGAHGDVIDSKIRELIDKNRTLLYDQIGFDTSYISSKMKSYTPFECECLPYCITSRKSKIIHHNKDVTYSNVKNVCNICCQNIDKSFYIHSHCINVCLECISSVHYKCPICMCEFDFEQIRDIEIYNVVDDEIIHETSIEKNVKNFLKILENME